MEKQKEIDQEVAKLNKIFANVEENKRQLVQGLIQEAAFLKVENIELRNLLSKTGMVKTHPQYPNIQKPIPAAEQYRKNLNSYSIVIKALNGILQKNTIEEDDGFEDWLKEQREGK